MYYFLYFVGNYLKNPALWSHVLPNIHNTIICMVYYGYVILEYKYLNFDFAEENNLKITLLLIYINYLN